MRGVTASDGVLLGVSANQSMGATHFDWYSSSGPIILLSMRGLMVSDGVLLRGVCQPEHGGNTFPLVILIGTYYPLLFEGGDGERWDYYLGVSANQSMGATPSDW